jgi:hypothetical protein
VKKVLLPLAGMPNQRDMDALQSLIEGKDQRFRGVYIIPIDNPLVGSRKVYVEKRPGFEAANIGDCLGVVSEGCNATAIYYSSSTGQYITAFCGSDVFVNCTSVGETVDPEPDPEDPPLCDPMLECFFAGDSGADVSGGGATFAIGDNTISNEAIVFENNPQTSSQWTDGDLNNHNGSSWTWQFYLWCSGGLSGAASRGLSSVTGTGTDARLFLSTNTTGFTPFQLLYRDGNSDYSECVESYRGPDGSRDELRLNLYRRGEGRDQFNKHRPSPALGQRQGDFGRIEYTGRRDDQDHRFLYLSVSSLLGV